jgi:hypothetical protein
MGTKRKIYDYNSVEIGELELPNNTSEEVWQEKLAVYAQPGVIGLPDVTPRQMRQALILSGVSLTDIDAALDSLPEPTKSLAKIEWEYSIAFKRLNPLVASVGQILGWTSQQLDDLWKLAGTL